jgi:hypothetical protein
LLKGTDTSTGQNKKEKGKQITKHNKTKKKEAKEIPKNIK